MNPAYTLYYYSGKGRGEPIRMMFALAGVPYEDVRFEHDEWIEKHKANAPYGQCPYLEIRTGAKTVTLSHSATICRYLAREWGFTGSSLLDQCKIDMIADSVEDFMVKPSVQIRREKDEDKKNELRKTFADETLPRFFAHLEKQFIRNKGGNEWFVGDKISWADVMFAVYCYWLPNGSGVAPPLDRFPKLGDLVKRVEAQPNIDKWMATRPATEL